MKFRSILATLLLTGAAFGQDALSSPVGRWQTISDVDGKPNGVIAISEDHGELTGRIAVLRPGSPSDKVCGKCPGDRHGKALLGMLILSGLRQQGDEWSGGQILDPDAGKVYKVKLKLEDGGKKLMVRGYMGFSLLGRTQTWIRLDGPR